MKTRKIILAVGCAGALLLAFYAGFLLRGTDNKLPLTTRSSQAESRASNTDLVVPSEGGSNLIASSHEPQDEEPNTVGQMTFQIPMTDIVSDLARFNQVLAQWNALNIEDDVPSIRFGIDEFMATHDAIDDLDE